MLNNSINQQTFNLTHSSKINKGQYADYRWAVLKVMVICHRRIYQINPFYQYFGWEQELVNIEVKQNVSLTGCKYLMISLTISGIPVHYLIQHKILN